MPIRFKIDEDLPGELAEVLVERGHDAVSVLEQQLGGSADHDLWAVVQNEHRVLITADKGFADVRTYSPGRHFGVVLLRLHHESRRGYVSLLSRLVEHADVAQVARSITVVTPSNIRVLRARESGD